MTLSVRLSVFRSVLRSLKGGKFHRNAPIGALVFKNIYHMYNVSFSRNEFQFFETFPFCNQIFFKSPKKGGIFNSLAHEIINFSQPRETCYANI